MAGRKHGIAVTEHEIEKRARLQAETERAIKAFRDSIADDSGLNDYDPHERPTSPTIIVNNHLMKSARPVKHDSVSPDSIKSKVIKVGIVAAAVGGGVIGILKAIGVIK
jgi:hypothetical protein